MGIKIIGLFGAGALCISASALAFPDGPQPRFTGGEGYEDCSACHFAGPDTTSNSGITLHGLAEQMVAGERYQLVLEVRDPEQRVGGFQLAIRDVEGPNSVGEFAEVDELRVVKDERVEFLSHRVPQRAEQDGDYQVTRWYFEWLAGAGDAIEVSAAAVAADDDDSALGDNVYTFSRIISAN